MSKPEVSGMLGCTDHGCIFGHPGGMGTNGGCHCLDYIRPLELRRKVMRNIQLMREELRKTQPVGAPARSLALQAADTTAYVTDLMFRDAVCEVLRVTQYVSAEAIDEILKQLEGRPEIVIRDGQPLTRNADGSMHRSSVPELVAEIERLRTIKPKGNNNL